MDLIEFLENVGCDVEMNIDRVNHGGCSVFASLMVEYLTRNGIRARGISAGYSGKYNSIAVARKNVRKSCDLKRVIDMTHVGVEFYHAGTRYHCDSRGVVMAHSCFDGMPVHRGRLTREELKSIANTPGHWNPQFDRKQIPKMKKIFARNFARFGEVEV